MRLRRKNTVLHRETITKKKTKTELCKGLKQSHRIMSVCPAVGVYECVKEKDIWGAESL